MTVSGADRAGIVAQVTVRAGRRRVQHPRSGVGCRRYRQQAGLYHADRRVADAPVESIEHALEPLRRDGVDVNVSAIETYRLIQGVAILKS